jgi:hypothetical protein
MRRETIWLAILGAALGLRGAAGGDDELARIRAKAADRLARIPNYTCLETIERRWHEGECRACLVSERVRLEVATIEGKDQFTWPGASQSDDRDLNAVLGRGLLQRGEFSEFPRALFGSQSAAFTRIGEQALALQREVRYDYRVPRGGSTYVLSVEGARWIVGFRGSFWVDPETLDLTRLEAEADDIPPELRGVSAKTVIEYALIKIGRSEFLLPRFTDFRLTRGPGIEDRNITHYSQCRQFAVESNISFGDQPAERRAERIREGAALPPGTILETELVTPILRATSAVGDMVEATVRRQVRSKKGQVLAPKGAIVDGRILLLESEGPRDALGLRFDRLRFGGTSVKLDVSVVRCSGTYLSGLGKYRGLDDVQPGPILLFWSGLQTLPKGVRLRLQTAQTPGKP